MKNDDNQSGWTNTPAWGNAFLNGLMAEFRSALLTAQPDFLSHFAGIHVGDFVRIEYPFRRRKCRCDSFSNSSAHLCTGVLELANSRMNTGRRRRSVSATQELWAIFDVYPATRNRVPCSV